MRKAEEQIARRPSGFQISGDEEMVENYIVIENTKYMWDGNIHENEKDAQDTIAEYEKEDFETKLVEKDNQFLVYTRRVVTEIVVDGGAPP